MRDQDILSRFALMTDVMSSDNSKIQGNIVLIRTRVDGLENLMLGSRFGILKMIILQLLSPTKVAKLVRYAHADQINKYNLARAEAEKKRSAVKSHEPIKIIKAV